MSQKDVVHYRKDNSRVSLCGLSGIKIEFTKNAEEVNCIKCNQRLGEFIPQEIKKRLASKSLQPVYRE